MRLHNWVHRLARAVGHTHAAAEGTPKDRSGHIVVTNTEREAQRIRREYGRDAMPLSRAEDIVAANRPVVFDAETVKAMIPRERLAGLHDVQEETHANSKSHGFYDDAEMLERMATFISNDDFMALRRRLILARLAMIGSEVGEAVDAVRASDINTTKFSVETKDGRRLLGTEQGSELADIVIRTLDLAEFMGIDLAAEIEAKMAYNATREHRHGKLA